MYIQRKRERKEKGQSIVEFALILPFLLLILCGIIDFGWILSCQNELTNAAGETARYAAIYSNKDNVTSLTEEFLSEQGITGTPHLSSLSIDDTFATVHVTENVNFLTGMSGVFFRKNYITLSAKASMPIEPYETEEETEEEETEEREPETTEAAPVMPETSPVETESETETVPETSETEIESETETETEQETTAKEPETTAKEPETTKADTGSGTIQLTSKMSGMKVKISPSNHWGSGNVTYQVTITVSNSTSKNWGTDWSCAIDFGADISSQTFWGPSTTVSGSVITFKPADQWNGIIGANGAYSFGGQITVPEGTNISDVTLS